MDFSTSFLDELADQSRAPKWSRWCLKGAFALSSLKPVLIFAGMAMVALLTAVAPVTAQTGGPIVTGNPNSPIATIRQVINFGVFLLMAAGVGGVGWAFINGMRRHSFGAQLIFGIASLGFGGIVALLKTFADGGGVDLPSVIP